MQKILNATVVTRHSSLVEYLTAIGLIDDSAVVVGHVSEDDVIGKDVVGVLPHSLSCLANSFTEVPLQLPAELRGKELTVEDLKQHAGAPVTYQVVKISS